MRQITITSSSKDGVVISVNGAIEENVENVENAVSVVSVVSGWLAANVGNVARPGTASLETLAQVC